MSELEMLEALRLLLYVIAFGVAWLCGVSSVRFFIYVKNHKDFF